MQGKLWDEVIWGAWVCDPKQGLVCMSGKCSDQSQQEGQQQNSDQQSLSDLIEWDCPTDWL